MDKSQERVDRFFLSREGTGVPEYSSRSRSIDPRGGNDYALYDSPNYSQGDERSQMPPISSPISQTSGTTPAALSSSTYHSCSDSLSQRSSPSTAMSSISSTPPQQTLNQPINSIPNAYSYDLPCEFGVLGCYVRFSPQDFEHWINHTFSHFDPLPPPPEAICTFCDNGDAIFRSQGDARENWRQRMIHIGYHLQNFELFETTRPDFFVLDYLQKTNLISSSDYKYAIRFSERPLCDGLVPRRHKTRKMKEERDRNQRQEYDLQKERRVMQREEKNHRHRRTQSTLYNS